MRRHDRFLQVVGASRIGAMLLINMAVPQAFIAMRNLMDRHCLRAFYGGPSAKEDVSLASSSWANKVTPVSGGSILPVRHVDLVHECGSDAVLTRIFDTLLADCMPKGASFILALFQT